MSSSLSNLVDNLSEGLHSGKCTDCKYCLDYMMLKDDQLIFRCFECKKNYKKGFNKELIKRFKNTYEFCNKDVDETSLPDKEAFYSSLNMENITDIEYRHENKVFKKFKLKNLGDYHDLYAIYLYVIHVDTLLLADVFENFRNKCIEIYELDPAHFLSTPRLAWQAYLEKKQK